MIKPTLCPCCGNTELYTGHLSFDKMGVHCISGTEDDTTYWLVRQGKIKPKDLQRPEFQGCGLKLGVPLPSEFPEDLVGDLPPDEAMRKLEELTLEEAIRRWNRRSP